MGQTHVIMSYLKDLNMISVLLRLFLAVVFGGIIGLSAAATAALRASGRTSWCA